MTPRSDEPDYNPGARALRREVRGWLEANRPAELVGLEFETVVRAPDSPALDAWTEKLHEAGYICAWWPEEFGGRGFSAAEMAVLHEEFARADVPLMTRGIGELTVAPSILAWGSDEQKRRLLPRILDGTDRYCQGFSEPEAGSDLAGLRTRGVVDGDEVVITGQKVWTSGAERSTMMFCLCRTDPEAPKHRSLSYVLVPLRRADGSSNGIELRPIRQLTGDSHFTETFLTGARAPLANVIGGLQNGWRVAMTSLGSERSGGATTLHVPYAKQFRQAVDLVRAAGRDRDPLVRDVLARAFTQVEIMRYQGLRTMAAAAAGTEPGPAAALGKLLWSEHAQRFAEHVVDIRGAQSMIEPEETWNQRFLYTRSVTIWGGTSQVQRNIVAERLLGLPKEPPH